MSEEKKLPPRGWVSRNEHGGLTHIILWEKYEDRNPEPYLSLAEHTAALAAAREEGETRWPERDEIARAIYQSAGGMPVDDAEYEALTGQKRRAWRLPGNPPWDENSETELCEWERDEYRYQASAVLSLFRAAASRAGGGK